MPTEVKHGQHPEWSYNTSGEFFCTVTGHYTDHPAMGCAGVTDHKFQSERPVKQLAELLNLRTAFLSWYVDQYVALGGEYENAVKDIRSFNKPQC